MTSADTAHDMARLRRCLALIRVRQRAADLLGGVLGGPPLFDMLLSLYAAELEGRALCQSAIATRAARASAHRHSATLVEQGMAGRQVDPNDRRRKTVMLTRDARQALDHLMDALPEIS